MKSQIFSVVENKLFHQKISEINQGSKAFEKNQSEEYMLPIENKIVFTDGDYDLPEITRIIEVVDEYATNFETIKELIYDVERGKAGHRDAVQTIENSFGKGYILQYESGSNIAYEWETGRRKGKNRREAVRNCLKQQQRRGNDSQITGNDEEIKKSLKAEDDAPYGDHKKRQKETITFAAPVILNGLRGNMAVVVNFNGNKYNAHRIILPDGTVFTFSEINKEVKQESYQGVAENSSLADTTSFTSKKSISKESEKVNIKNPSKPKMMRFLRLTDIMPRQ